MNNISDLTLTEMKKYLSKIGDKEGAKEIKEIIEKLVEKLCDVNVKNVNSIIENTSVR